MESVWPEVWFMTLLLCISHVNVSSRLICQLYIFSCVYWYMTVHTFDVLSWCSSIVRLIWSSPFSLWVTESLRFVHNIVWPLSLRRSGHQEFNSTKNGASPMNHYRLLLRPTVMTPSRSPQITISGPYHNLWDVTGTVGDCCFLSNRVLQL